MVNDIDVLPAATDKGCSASCLIVQLLTDVDYSLVSCTVALQEHRES